MTNEQIIAAGQQIYDETEVGANTSERIGGVIRGIGQRLATRDTEVDEALTQLANQNAGIDAKNGYYTNSQAASESALTVTAPGYVLSAGGNIRIKMEHANTASSVTLNINGTGAKALYYNGEPVDSENSWKDGEVIIVYYADNKYFATNSLNNPTIDVVNDLTTGGENNALSAEMGKILKQIVDRLQEISVDGITGFVPISSLNDLPLSPTSEQRGQAYILDNALYVYVGTDGDTLDGKYKSVQLVTLDWNDKVYDPPIFNGYGRTTLKKNIISDENVLTAAMLSTANTEYYIQYDYDLKGATVTLPANVTLIFIGGSIKNGTLIGDNTRIQAKKGTVIFYDVIIKGTWDVDHAWSSWFNCSKDGYKIIDIGKGEQVETNIELSLGGACYVLKIRDTDPDEFLTGNASIDIYIAPVSDYKMLHIVGRSSNTRYGVTFYNSNSVFDLTTMVARGVSSNSYYDKEVEVPDGSTYVCIPVVKNTVDFYVKGISYENIDDAHAWYVIEKSDGTTEKLPYSTAPSGIVFSDDTVKLQSLIDLNAHHTTIEEGVYMINAHRYGIDGTETSTNHSKFCGLFFHEKFGQTLEINGVLKHDSTHDNFGRYILAVQSTRNCNIIGNGELQGDMCEDPSARVGRDGPATGLLIADCVDLTIRGIAAKYNSSDGIWARYRWGLTDTVKEQIRHKLEFVTMSYNHRDGLVYENGDDVTVENCVFEGNGTIKGTNDKAAVDVEPFRQNSSQGVYRRYCENFIFRHNRFYNTQKGLKLERCINTIVCDNIFQNGMDIEYKYYGYNIYPDCYGTAIVLYDSGLAAWDDYGELIISANQKWLNSRVHIYNNKAENFSNFVHAVNGGRPNSFEAHDNLIVNSALTNDANGTSYSYAFQMECCSNTRVHHNKIISGIGIALIDGRSDFFSFAKNIEVDNNLLILGYTQNANMSGATAASPFRVISPDIMDYTIHDNIIESPLNYDRHLLLGSGKFGRGYTEFVQPYAHESRFPVLNGKNIFKGKNIFRQSNVGTAEDMITEDSWQAAAGAKFISNEYKQEGIVVKNWKKAYFDKTFESNLPVSEGEWLQIPITTTQGPVVTAYWLCCNSGTLGDISELPNSQYTYSFISGNVRLSCLTFKVGGDTPIINWTSRGICTEDNRPTTLNSVGRELLERYRNGGTNSNPLNDYRVIVCTAVNQDGTGVWREVPNVPTLLQNIDNTEQRLDSIEQANTGQ